MLQHWRRLHLSDESAPPLLYKYNTTAKGYEFYLTDLTYIWSERLDHRDVLQRAEDEETSIDPSDDAEQFSVLLQKIQDAFLGSKNSRVVLKPGLKSNSLEVTTIAQLPAPLKPLRWTLYLSREPPTEFTRQLFLPLLKEQVDHDRRERSLLDQLREKDWVLGKIFDKIESSGLDLSTVFPGTAGLRGAKKGTSLTHAAKFVKGVAPFDEKAWRSSFDSGNVGLSIATDLVDQVSDPSSALDRLDAAPDRWWGNLNAEEPVSKPSRTKKTETRYEKSSTAAPLNREDTASLASSDEDEFQRQETPPKLKRAKQKPQQVDHPTTESDEDAEPVPRKRSTSPARPQLKLKRKGLGVIGGPKAAPTAPEVARSPSSKASEKSPEPPPTTSGIPPATAAAAGEETESDEALPPPRPKQVADSTTESAKPTGLSQKRVLGTIGGRKAKPREEEMSDSAVNSRSRSRSRSRSTDDESQSPTSTTQTKPPVKRTTGKLGVIGGAKKTKNLPSRTPPAATAAAAAEATASSDNDLDSDTAMIRPKYHPSPSQSPPAAQPAPKPEPEPEPERELTAQEKADKKREELKRQLEEAKSRAPGKKKRRF